jgi:hypothetical protein
VNKAANKPPVTYVARSDTNPQAELNALCAVYAYLLNKKAVEPAPEPDSCNDAAIMRYTEGVSHVEQRPERPSEIT